MNMKKENKLVEKLKDKTLALFFTEGVSLKTWYEIGMIDREVAIYNKLSKYFKHIYFFTYGGKEDLKFKNYLADNITIIADNITIIPKKHISSSLLYSFMIPFIHRKILKDVDVLKTNQMWGSWSAVLTKLIYRNKLVVRTGYMLSIRIAKDNPNRLKKWLIKNIERIAYKLADGIITTSKSNLEYVERNYKPRGIHVLIPNYVETGVFKPMEIAMKKGSICFIGRLTKQKNLFALLEALKGLPYTVSIIGSGEQEEQLKTFATTNKVNAKFLGNIPNHDLPEILNQHELFILPSLWEGMPKTLLEAMACGLPVIGTNVDGIKEVIERGENGILCGTDPKSIKEAIINLMNDEMLKVFIGEKARKTAEERFSLDKLIERELALYRYLVKCS
jgi:glycosyltransferase involved in cell wall biosynthesis